MNLQRKPRRLRVRIDTPARGKRKAFVVPKRPKNFGVGCIEANIVDREQRVVAAQENTPGAAAGAGDLRPEGN
ncbi:MAG: hypothetical protein WDO72_12690 [Pseudomonadota bacterium]